ncbi:MAG: hypothetical protein ACE5JP_06985 [Candidatus Bipolaricaulia bacterium]
MSSASAGLPVLGIRAIGRGRRCRTNTDAFGFPRGYRMRRKRVQGMGTSTKPKEGAVAPPHV